MFSGGCVTGNVGLAQAETTPDFVLVKRESSSRRPSLFSVLLTLSEDIPHYITAVSGSAAREILPGDFLIAIDQHVVAEVACTLVFPFCPSLPLFLRATSGCW